MNSIEEIRQSARLVMTELLETVKAKPGQLLLIGCSSSEITGHTIGTASHTDVAEAVFDEIYSAVQSKGLSLAVQCCEHLNRALVMERAAVTWEEEVNVIPQPHAGGAVAAVAYQRLANPVVVEFTKADIGLDIGDTFIGMHMKHVAVPVRLSVKDIGAAHITACRVRPKSIGGVRAVYNEALL